MAFTVAKTKLPHYTYPAFPLLALLLAGQWLRPAGSAGPLAILRGAATFGSEFNTSNPNGSIDDIAGVCNDARNVVGLMPHPERASDAVLGSSERDRNQPAAPTARAVVTKKRRPGPPSER